MRLFAYKFFLNGDIARNLQFAQMRGQVTEGQPGLTHQEEEIGAFHNVQVRHDHEPCGFVNQAVYIGKRLKLFASHFSHRYELTPLVVWDTFAGSGLIRPVR